MKDLEEYHYVWLEEHPTRTEVWLRERMKDGFHIHHIDGDHSNNHPHNLVLVDGQDHMRNFHGMRMPSKKKIKKKIKLRIRKERSPWMQELYG